MDAADLVAAWFAMCRGGDEGAFGRLAVDGFRAHGPGGSSERDGFLAWLRWYPTVFAEQRHTVEDLIAAGDRVVVRYTVVSAYRGGFLGLPGSGQQVRESGIMIFRLEGGRVAETWFQGNDLEVAQQLGGRIAAPAEG